MRLEPLSVILDKDFKIEKKFYFISGNEATLIQKIKSSIIEKYKKKEKAVLTTIEFINDFFDTGGLFEEKKIFLVNNCKGIEESSLDNLRNIDGIFIFVQENSQKIKKTKNIFLKDKDSLLIDCYELDKNSKIKILNESLKSKGLIIEKDLYWYLIEKLDGKFALVEDSLDKILKLNQKDITLLNIRKLLTTDDSSKEKIFFFLLKKNKEIVEVYRERVFNASDVNDLYYYCRFFCQLIIDSKNEEVYRKKIPIYLFREKIFLIDIYRKYNSTKKILLLKLLSSTERVLRKEGGLSLVSGLRFLLNIKKITIS